MKKWIQAFVFFWGVGLWSLPLYAGFYGHYSLNIHSDSDDVQTEKFSYSTMKNFIYFGAAVGNMQRFIVGQSVVQWSRDNQTGEGGASSFSVLELGPRFFYYMGESGNFGLSLAYHPYVRGSRQVAGGESENISGSAFLVGVHLMTRLSKSFYVGASLHYHATTISESVQGETSTTVSESYSGYYPTLCFSLRFK